MNLKDVKVVSYVPGRVRLKVAALKQDPEFAEAVRTDLADVPGVKGVDVRPDTGSVLIRYDRKAVASPESLDALSGVLERHFPSLDSDKLRGWLGKAT